MHKSFLALCASALCALGACTDPTDIGDVFFDGSQLPVTITDTVELRLRSVGSAGALANQSANFASIPVGCLESPVTGEVRARLGLELVELAAPRLVIDEIAVDSVVLILPVNPATQLGDTTARTSLRVRSAAPGTIRLATALFDTPLETTGKTYGTYEGPVPRRSGKATTFVADTARVDSVGPQLRIRLNDDFLADARAALSRRTPADTLRRDSLFAATFAGIIVEGGAACAKTIPTVDFSTSGATTLGVTIYYKQGGKTRQFRLINRRLAQTQQGNILVGPATLRAEYQRDISGSLLERLREGNGPANDSFAVVQAFEGSLIEVSFPDLSGFGTRRGVTFAELEVPVVPGSGGQIRPIESLVVQIRAPSGDLVPYSALPATQQGVAPVFREVEGGVLTTIADPRGGTDSVQVYRFNVTSLFQSFVSGRRADATLYLAPRNPRALGGETLVYGPGAGQLRTRLRVASAVLP